MDDKLHDKLSGITGFRQWEKDYNEHDEKSNREKSRFLQHLLLVASGTLGVLISLHSKDIQQPHIRWVFFAGLILLAACILSSVMALYYVVLIREYQRKRFLKELTEYVCENRGYDLSRIRAGKRNVLIAFQLCSVCLYLLAMILLTCYAIFK